MHGLLRVPIAFHSSGGDTYVHIYMLAQTLLYFAVLASALDLAASNVIANYAVLELTGGEPKVEFGGVLTLIHNSSEDKLVCSGTFEAADVRIAGTSTTVADLIREVATLRQEMAAVKEFVGMMPPPAMPPPSPPSLPPWPPLDLTVTPSGTYTGHSEVISSSTLHAADRDYRFGSIPAQLEGSTYFQPCCHMAGWHGLNLTMTISRPAIIYICAEVVGGSGRDCGFSSSLPSLGFIQTSFGLQLGMDTCWEKGMNAPSLSVTLPGIVGKPPAGGERPNALECVHGTFVRTQT